MKKPPKTGDGAINKAIRLHSALAEFDSFKQNLPKDLRKLILKGATAKELRQKYLPYLQARQIQNALAEPASAKSDTAVQRILDREFGKSTEKKEIEHRLGALTDEQIDAHLRSAIEEVVVDEEDD